MRITDARDRSIVPLHDFIHQAHQIGVGDQRANFRFVDWQYTVIAMSFAQPWRAVIPSEVEEYVALPDDSATRSFDSAVLRSG